MMHDDNFRSRSQLVRKSARANLLEIRRARLAKRMLAPAMATDLVEPLAAVEDAAVEDNVQVPVVEDVIPTVVVETAPPAVIEDATPEPPDALEQAAVQRAAFDEPTEQAALVSPGVTAAAKPKKSTRKSTGSKAKKPTVSPVDVAAAEPDALSGPIEDIDDRTVQIAAMAEMSDEVPVAVEPGPIEVVAPSAPDLPQTPATELPEAVKPVVIPTVVEVAASAIVCDLNALPGAGPGLVWMLQQCGIHSMNDLAAAEAADLTPKLGLIGQILNVQTWLDYARIHTASGSLNQ